MRANHDGAVRQHRLINKYGVALATLFFSVFFATANISAQNNFSSGSTGADGAFAPVANQTITVPDSGVFNYTTVNIPANVTITYARGNGNKPLTILATGDVTMGSNAVINLDGKPGNANGSGGFGGPGGYSGGAGGYGFDQSFSGVPADGPGAGGGGKGGPLSTNLGGGGGGGYGSAGSPGGGGATAGLGGPKFGTVTILPLIGGSGGGGGGAINNGRGGAGGGGGGAILIASSGTITLSGTITVRGGSGASGNAGGAGGSGGAIRLIANTITGGGVLTTSGGFGGGSNVTQNGGTGGQGYVRLEAYDYSNFTGSTNPSNIVSFAFPHPLTPTNSPSLHIASVGGVNAPASPLGSLQGVPDIIVPSAQPNPVTVALEGTNLPLSTIVQVTLTPATGNRTTVQSSGLAGTEPASTASASITLPAGISVVTASAVIDLTIASAKPLFLEGERVNRIEVAATFGGASELTYVTQSGRRIKRSVN
jgi:hypothetical protein